MTPAFSRPERGVVLFAVLIMLLLVSLLVVVSLRTSLLQERMTSGTRDRAMALQNAESALVQAEQLLAGIGPDGGPVGLDCSQREGTPDVLCMPHPSLGGVSAPGRGWTATADLQPDGLGAGAPAFAVQYLGRRDAGNALGLEDEPNYGEASGRVEAEFYRVIARGADPQATPDRAQVLLQSTVVRE
ncbi:PilX N-terminal domain-containing pilus assembly protein [Stenotrophomonas sp. 24(2023)]|uniref:pilus assembly PilX family protein n=1 Tax=Stenotrophomonas sp. 24(2023) TaxID=3068324 RepID=UPI0027E0EFF9|nr:PilX N-terminal domain-containing pilus assembly protein [Stenotrophomonas sp. 24(2023)]WMJ70940.1 PilX N-terminal domain-containing pilus assembly protein [Stenotrophomonas sp. 24(2023)]